MVRTVQTTVGILARGPWAVEDVEAHWREERFQPDAEKVRAADDAIRELAQRGSPSHDGVAGRVVQRPGRVVGILELRRQRHGDRPLRMAVAPFDATADTRVAVGIHDHVMTASHEPLGQVRNEEFSSAVSHRRYGDEGWCNQRNMHVTRVPRLSSPPRGTQTTFQSKLGCRP